MTNKEINDSLLIVYANALEIKEKEIDELVKALRDLYDEQNGAPLARREAKWQTAFENATELLKKHEK